MHYAVAELADRGNVASEGGRLYRRATRLLKRGFAPPHWQPGRAFVEGPSN